MLKGHLDIKVFDKDGNLKQHEQGENLITNHTYDFLKATLANKVNNILQDAYPKTYSSNIIKDFEGILLFDSLLEENPDNYFNQLMASNVIGHAGSGETVYDAPQSGTINSTETEITENSIKKVWIFGQGKASGTIQSVGLTNTILGTKGTFDFNFKNNTEGYYINVDSRFNKNNTYFNKYINKVINPQYIDGNFEGIIPVFEKNGIFYCYKNTISSNQRTIDIYKIDISNIYNKQNFVDKIAKRSSNSWEISFISNNVEPEYTYTTSVASSSSYKSVNVGFIGNKIYFSTYDSNNLAKIIYFDTDTELFSEVLNNTITSGAQYQNRYAVPTNKGIFLPSSDWTKIAQFTNNFVFMQFIDLPEDILAQTNSTEFYIFPYNDDLMKLYFSNNSAKFSVLTDAVNYKFPEQGQIMYTHQPINPNYLNLTPYMISNGANYENYMTPYMNNMYLSTIKNLENPVTKGTDDVMNVTYTIIKQE